MEFRLLRPTDNKLPRNPQPVSLCACTFKTETVLKKKFVLSSKPPSEEDFSPLSPLRVSVPPPYA